MSRSNIIEDVEINLGEDQYQEDISVKPDKDLSKSDHATARKRIDELLEKKRLQELLDEDEWQL